MNLALPGSQRLLLPVQLLLVLFAAAVLIPVLAVGSVVLLRIAQEDSAQVARSTEAIAQRGASVVNGRIDGISIALDALSESRSIDAADDNAFEQRAADVAVLAGRPIRYRLNDGRVVELRAPEAVGIWVNAPVERGGAQIGVVEAQLTGIELSRALAAEAPSSDWTLSIVSKAGRIVARSKDYADFEGKLATADLRANATGAGGSWEGRTLDGQRVAAAYKRTAKLDLVVAAGVPLEVVAAPFERSAAALGAMTVLALALSGGLGAAVGSWIGRPLRRLASSSANLPTTAPTAGPTSVREIAELEHALGRAAHNLISHEREQQKEIAKRARTERRLRLVVNELNHRVKNTLAVVQSLAVQTIGRATDTDAALKAFGGRLHTLAGAHDLLTAAGWEGADLRQLIEASLEPLAGVPTRLRCSGPEVLLPSETAVSLAMVLHELGTNAVKYGALSVSSGYIVLDWQIDHDELNLVWEEVGGPAVQLPTRTGFGTRLIERALTGSRQPRVEFASTGLRWSCAIPLRQYRLPLDDKAGAGEQNS